MSAEEQSNMPTALPNSALPDPAPPDPALAGGPGQFGGPNVNTIEADVNNPLHLNQMYGEAQSFKNREELENDSAFGDDATYG